jgi:hypothetical protein
MSTDDIVTETINIKKVLEKLALHEAQLVDSSDALICKCKFEHIFTIFMDDDWCLKCDDDFMESQKQFHNAILKDNVHGLCIYQFDKYGTASLICSNNHMNDQSFTNILPYCVQCVSNETPDEQPEQIEWSNFMGNPHTDEIENLQELFNTTCFEEESDENHSDFYEYGSDSDNTNIYNTSKLSFNPEWDGSDFGSDVDVQEYISSTAQSKLDFDYDMINSKYNLTRYDQKNDADDIDEDMCENQVPHELENSHDLKSHTHQFLLPDWFSDPDSKGPTQDNYFDENSLMSSAYRKHLDTNNLNSLDLSSREFQHSSYKQRDEQMEQQEQSFENLRMKAFVDSMKEHAQMMDFSTIEYNPIEPCKSNTNRQLRLNNMTFNLNVLNNHRYQILKKVHVQIQEIK